MEKQERVNEHVQQRLAEIMSRRLALDGYMITVAAAYLSPDQKRLKVFVSVLPDKYNGTALQQLRKLGPAIKGELCRAAKLREAPRINWLIDNTEAKAAELDEIFKQI
ncbi:MAG: ribosome-binding factor A [Candidatus Falkowbacteria bacterium]